jgi:hypothetical protein
MADADIAALRHGYADRAALVGERLVAEIHALTADDELREPSRILAALVSNGILDLKVALVSRDDLVASSRVLKSAVGGVGKAGEVVVAPAAEPFCRLASR